MAHLGAHAFDTIGGEVVTTTTFVIQKSKQSEMNGSYIRLVKATNETEKRCLLLESVSDQTNTAQCYYASSRDFVKIPGMPIAYWASNPMRMAFYEGTRLEMIAKPELGMRTGDNARFLRYWYEIGINNCSLSSPSAEEARKTGLRWFPYNKGGSFRKWYGNREFLVNWQNDGYEIKKNTLRNYPQLSWDNLGWKISNEEDYFKEGITWGDVSSGSPSFRYTPEGSLFDGRGSSAFPPDRRTLTNVLGVLNSCVIDELVGVINPTLVTSIGALRQIPIIQGDTRIYSRVEHLINISRSDWDSYEISWDFASSPILQAKKNGYDELDATYVALRRIWQSVSEKTKSLEEKSNHVLIAAYGLQDELSPNVPLNEITLTCNPHYRYGSAHLKAREWEAFGQQFPDAAARLAEIAAGLSPETPEATRLALEQRLLDDTMREFISYAVGCMFGRYSLDKPGLVLANQGETLDDYLEKVSGQWTVGSEQAVTFMPEADNVLPVLDGDWFANDITARFKAFLKVTFGESHYAENLAFIEAAIGRDVRSYFLRDFYNDHVKTYKKRPIYWLFSSRNGSFNALVYMHRYRPDTASIVLNDYLREFRAKLTARRQHLDQVSLNADAAPREKTQALKESEALDNVLRELREYEDAVLYPLATRQVEIDLDDGVAVNYAKLGKALKHVSGLSEK